MPWHQEPMKDATNGETPRGAVSTRRSVGLRMGEPNTWKTCYPAMEGKRGELKYLSTRRKRK